MGAIGRGQSGPLLTLEVVLQNQLTVGIRQNEIDARALEIAGEKQMCVRNDNGAGRCMRGNTIDMDVSAQVSVLTVKQHIGKFTGQCQMGTVAAKVNTNTIFKCLILHITGKPCAEPSIACASRSSRVVYQAAPVIHRKY